MAAIPCPDMAASPGATLCCGLSTVTYSLSTPGLGDFCVREREINTLLGKKGYGVPVYMGVCSVLL
ncbi:MAG: hypothetical protein ACK55Z_00280 [bacterium]